MDKDEETKELIKTTVGKAVKECGYTLDKVILFGSRARGDYDRWSDWDILVVVKEKLGRKEKEDLFTKINERLAKFLIPTDIIIKSSEELEYYRDFYGTATYEALKEGLEI